MDDAWIADWALDYAKSANTVLVSACAQLDMVHGAFRNMDEYGELRGRLWDADCQLSDALGLLDDARCLIGSFLEDAKENNGQQTD